MKEQLLIGFVILEDGTIYKGNSFGASGETLGEVVFNTSMTGYQEILTDPSYSSQIVTMTYPLIGNYGVNNDDIESDKIHAAGFIVKEACRYPSNFASTMSLPDYLEKNGIIGIEGVDTRSLTRHIRLAGSMKAVLYAGNEEPDIESLTAKARKWKGLEGVDTVKNVTCSKKHEFKLADKEYKHVEKKYHIVAFDFGIKYNILRMLRKRGCRITVVPANTRPEKVLSENPDGIFLSNGPGDPAGVKNAKETVRELIGKAPIFGICLGHQILSLALGGITYKLKFGHHGANHPVRDIETGKIEITAQNHCFCADTDSLKESGVKMTHINLYDNTCEGIEDSKNSAFSVQYHPEASPGPHDADYLFDRFIEKIENF